MAKRSQFTDSDFGDYLRNLYDRAAVACGNDYKDEAHPMTAVRAWHSAVSSAPTETDDEGTEGETPMAGGGPGASDSRRWRAASPPVRQAMDAAMKISGIDQSARRAVAEAALRHAGYSVNDGLFTELSAYLNQAMKPRGAAASTRKAVAGYDRLK
jgi:hypothetical protein